MLMTCQVFPNMCSEEGHEHEVDNETAVVDVPFYIHASGKRSRLILHDENLDMSPLGLQRVDAGMHTWCHFR